MTRCVRVLFCSVGLLGGLPFLAEADPVATYVRLLTGHVDQAQSANVLVVPGTVVVAGQSAEQRATDVLRVIDELKDSYRLERVDVAESTMVAFEAGKAEKLPSVPGGPEISATLLAADDKSATFKVSLKQGAQALAEPTISVRHGGRAIVGARDGAAAPYLFLLLETLDRPAAKAGSQPEPKLVNRVNPSYPEAARKAKLEGLVLIELTIAADGTIRATRVVRGEPMGLTEAAVDAVKQWRYEPVRDTVGKPIEVKAIVTVRFRLG